MSKILLDPKTLQRLNLNELWREGSLSAALDMVSRAILEAADALPISVCPALSILDGSV